MKKIFLLVLVLLFVTLFSDIAWSQKKNRKPNRATKQKIIKPTYGKLNFEAGVYYQFGGLQKFSRSNFMLMNKDLNEIFSDEMGSGLANKIKRLYAIGKLINLTDENTKSPWVAIERYISPYIVASTITNFDGHGGFEKIKPGSYYLVHIGNSRGQFIVWNVPVNISAKNNSIILDQNNADFSD